MNNKLQISKIAIFLITSGIAIISSHIAWSDSDRDKDYCYDQVGDAQFCFDSKEKCRHEQKSDEIGESPCYNKDRM